MRHASALLALILLCTSAAAATSTIVVDDGWVMLTKELLRPDVPDDMRHPQVFKSGTGAVAGMIGQKAIFLSGDATGPNFSKVKRLSLFAPSQSFSNFGGLERRFPVTAWRGRRIAVTVRLRNEGDARGYVSVQIDKSNATAIRTASQVNDGQNSWHAHTLVLDVPDSATDISIVAGLTGKGTVWLDGFKLQAADPGMSQSWTERLPLPVFGSPCRNDCGPTLAVSYVPVVPGPFRKDGG